MQTPRTRRTPVVAAAALLVGLAVVAGILIVGRIGVTDPTPRPTISPPASAIATASPSPADPYASPEAVIRVFFATFAKARETDDPSVLKPFVTSEESDAYLTVAGFLNGQKAVGKASVLTEHRIENLEVKVAGTTATVTFDYTEVGYDIDLKTRVPRQTPEALPARKVTATVKQVNGQWRLDSYETTI